MECLWLFRLYYWSDLLYATIKEHYFINGKIEQKYLFYHELWGFQPLYFYYLSNKQMIVIKYKLIRL